MRLRHWITCVFLAALGLGLLTARAQSPTADDGLFARATQLEEANRNEDALAEFSRIIKEHGDTDLTITTEARFRKAALLIRMKGSDEALNEFDAIVRDNRNKNMERAARALYEAGSYASSTSYPGTQTQKLHALDKAYQLWRQLRDEYPATEAAKRIAGENGPMAQLMDRIDKRNSGDWRYQIIDSLVRLTGKQPAYSYALALILLAVLVKALLLPLTKRQYASMREMQRMQPLIKELQKKHKGAELNQKTMELYKEHKVNPFAGCFIGIVQIPFLILIFNAIREYEIAFAKGTFLWIGSALSHSGQEIMGQRPFGANLATPDIPLLALYVITNYVTMRMTPATDPQQQQQQNTMALMTSLLFFWMFLSYKWSSAFVLYWLALNLLSIWQQYEMIYKPHKEALANGAAGHLAAASNAGTSTPPETPSNNVVAGAPAPKIRPRRKKR